MYLFTLLSIFISISFIGEIKLNYVSDVKYLATIYKLAKYFQYTLASLIGIPPFSGFFVKLYLFNFLFYDVYIWFYCIILNFFLIFYYLNLFKFFFKTIVFDILLFVHTFWWLTDLILLSLLNLFILNSFGFFFFRGFFFYYKKL